MKPLPIIASITRKEQLRHIQDSHVNTVILITGSVINLKKIIAELHDWHKEVFVHIEMVEGIGKDAAAVRYLAEEFKADGIVSTKSNCILAAKNCGLKTIQRIFAIDSGAFEKAIKMIETSKPDKVELMPGLMPRIIREMKSKIRQPLIVGGLIRFPEEIDLALRSGADYVSIGDERFW